jgi:hypothetical protein
LPAHFFFESIGLPFYPTHQAQAWSLIPTPATSVSFKPPRIVIMGMPSTTTAATTALLGGLLLALALNAAASTTPARLGDLARDQEQRAPMRLRLRRPTDKTPPVWPVQLHAGD